MNLLKHWKSYFFGHKCCVCGDKIFPREPFLYLEGKKPQCCSCLDKELNLPLQYPNLTKRWESWKISPERFNPGRPR